MPAYWRWGLPLFLPRIDLGIDQRIKRTRSVKPVTMPTSWSHSRKFRNRKLEQLYQASAAAESFPSLFPLHRVLKDCFLYGFNTDVFLLHFPIMTQSLMVEFNWRVIFIPEIRFTFESEAVRGLISPITGAAGPGDRVTLRRWTSHLNHRCRLRRSRALLRRLHTAGGAEIFQSKMAGCHVVLYPPQDADHPGTVN